MLRDGEAPVGTLCQNLHLEPANVSQHLAILRSKGIVGSRKVANSVLYSIRDPAIIQVFEILRGYCFKRISEMAEMMQDLRPVGEIER